MTTNHRCGLVSALVSLVLFANAGARAGDVERARFEAEYPAALQRWEAQYARVRGSFALVKGPAPGPRSNLKAAMPRAVSRVTFAVDGPFRRVESERTVKIHGVDQALRMVNAKGPDGPYSLLQGPGDTHYTLNKIDEKVGNDLGFTRACGDFLFAAFMLNGQTLPEIQSHATSKLLGVERVPDAEGGGLRVEIERGPAGRTHLLWFTLDPDAHWAIRHSALVMGPPIVKNNPNSFPGTRFEIDYGPPVNGLPVPRVVRQYYGAGLDSTCTFDEVRFEPTPREEFLLSSFGVRAPFFRGWVAWFSGLVLASLIAFVLYRAAPYFRRRFAATH